MLDRRVRILLVARQSISACQCPHMDTEANHRVAMGRKIIRIAQSITPDVWAIRMVGVGPPVISLRIEIVRPAWAALAHSRGNGHRLIAKKIRGRLQDSVAL